MNDTYEYEKDDEDENGDANDGDDETGEKNNDLSKPDGDKVNFKGDELFKSVQMPNSLLHRNWGDSGADDFETNPW